MIDRVEELLELVEEQPDEDGQEDGLALELEQETGAPVVPVSGPEEDGEEDVPPPERDGGPEANSGPRAVPTGGGTGGPEWPEEMTKTDGGGAGEAPPPAWEARRLEAPVIPGSGPEAEADKGTLDRESGRDGPEQAQTERRPGVLEWHRAAQQSAAPAWRPEGTAGSGSQVWPEGSARNGGQIWQVEKFREGVPAWQGEGPRRTPETEEHHSVPQGPEEGRRGLEELYRQTAQAARERGRGEAREAGRTPARGGVKASERFGRFAA
ncbi:MAG: hypothetical protein HFF24_08660 [Oscillospiraceae bacterium]|nr:hypothetical protein [Oscillospiraceae bacterium]